jgi:hypothetical protein
MPTKKLSATVKVEFTCDGLHKVGDRFVKPSWYPDLKFVDLWVLDWISDDFDKSLLSEQARSIFEFPEGKDFRRSQLECPQCNPKI